VKLIDNPRGNYRFLPGIRAHGSGAIADPGYEVVHVVLRKPVPYAEGFKKIERHLERRQRPKQALCGIELRLPKALTFEQFAAANQGYCALLESWDLFVDGINPIARTNIAPVLDPPSEWMLYAFSYTRVSSRKGPSFVVAGAGDLLTQDLSNHRIIRKGETSADAMREKAAHVFGVLGERLRALGVAWHHVTAVDLVSAFPVTPAMLEQVMQPMRRQSLHGVHWFYARPPIIDLDFEADTRGVAVELRI